MLFPASYSSNSPHDPHLTQICGFFFIITVCKYVKYSLLNPFRVAHVYVLGLTTWCWVTYGGPFLVKTSSLSINSAYLPVSLSQEVEPCTSSPFHVHISVGVVIAWAWLKHLYFPVISERHSVTENFLVLRFLQYFHPIFCHVP